ncbi:GNAT family N-acetyltransferase [Amycolatopsis sp. NPDC049868]|uniref:GNAT family N-acetyltransferase n=1 Tax=Amycolatopsis sp. NPDC049868 TaxID=3363934 RepID=UPI0037A6E083
MKDLVDRYSGTVMLGKELATFYREMPDFFVVDDGGEPLACGALHIRSEGLGEIGTVAVRPEQHGRGIGSLLIRRLLEEAAAAGLRDVFVLTFETGFFARHGFRVLAEEPQPVSVGCGRMGLLAVDDASLFLDLGQAKVNTLGNTRMMLTL